jgi:transcriptional regulator with GAF, ATPase, and Fis domain
MEALLSPSTAEELDVARQIRLLSLQQWGDRRPITLIGKDPQFSASLELVRRFAEGESPILLLGETGTGKELLARAIYLLRPKRARAFIAVNCAQYGDSQLIASELFGHKRGSFTGAVIDHRGVFEEADGGIVFLDEVGELTLSAQAMLLRVLSEKEIVPVGETRPRPINARIIAATNRDLRALVAEGRFREDLFFRLRHLQVRVNPLRRRGKDWELMLHFFARCVSARWGVERRFSARSIERLASYRWPGNARELLSLVEASYYMAYDSPTIDPDAFEEFLEATPESGPGQGGHELAERILGRIADGEGTFWELIHDRFLERELNRQQVQTVIAEALRRSHWCYKDSLPHFGLAQGEYLRFMDFLRHHALKPKR